jgi:predicted S18 family serine protease
MPERAQVHSTDALESFRSHLIVYINQARPALEEAAAEVLRVRSWLENEQRGYWENQIRKRSKALEQAQQALFSARLGLLRRETAAEQMAFQRAKKALEQAEDKLRAVKKWAREFDSRVQPLLKQTDKLHTVFSNDLVKAVASLTQTINTLAAYAEISASPAPEPPIAASGAVNPDTPAAPLGGVKGGPT